MNASVLIVEDDPIIAFDIQQQLKDLHYQIHDVVPSGEQALQSIRETVPDVILMDIKLKGTLNGIQTAKQILSKARVPIIFVSACLSSYNLNSFNHLGICKCVSKPYDDITLQTYIQLALVQQKIEDRLSTHQVNPSLN